MHMDPSSLGHEPPAWDPIKSVTPSHRGAPKSRDSRLAQILALSLTVLAVVLLIPIQISGTGRAPGSSLLLADPLPIATIPVGYVGSNNGWYQTWIIRVYQNGCCVRTAQETGNASYAMRCFYTGPGRTFDLRGVLTKMHKMEVGPGEPVDWYDGSEGNGKTPAVHLETAPGFVGIILGVLGMLVLVGSRVVYPRAWRLKARPAIARERREKMGFVGVLKEIPGWAKEKEGLLWVAGAALACSLFAAAWLTGRAMHLVKKTSGPPFEEGFGSDKWAYGNDQIIGPSMGGGWAALMWLSILAQALGLGCLWWYYWVERKTEEYEEYTRQVELKNAVRAVVDNDSRSVTRVGTPPLDYASEVSIDVERGVEQNVNSHTS